MPDFSQLEGDLARIEEELRHLAEEELPAFMEQKADEIVQASFDKEAYQGKAGSPKWPERKRKSAKDRAKARRNLLVDSGRLKRSVSAERRGSMVVISTDTPYAQIHNEGGEVEHGARSELFQRNRKEKGKGKGRFAKGTRQGRGHTIDEHTTQMPQRQFMPIPGEDFPAMDAPVGNFLDEKMKKILGRQG